MRKLTQEDVKLLLIKNNLKVEMIDNYIRSKVKINFKCLSCGNIWKVSPNSILCGSGCPKCSRIMTKQDFVNKSKIVHGEDTYLYHLFDYRGRLSTGTIICRKHGEFSQRASTHMSGSGCQQCGLEKMSVNTTFSLGDFIKRSREIHGDLYNYDKFIYKSCSSKGIIICKKHGDFSQRASSHMQGYGCKKCGHEQVATLNKLTKNEFVKRANKIHGVDTFDYMLFEYINSEHKSVVICKKEGHGEFLVTPHNHLQGNGCPICKCSKGERKIRLFLLTHNIKFVQQKEFKYCVNKKKLPFDFYLPKYNLCIEFDGRHHYDGWWLLKYKNKTSEIETTKICDNIKTKYCRENNIKLIRIKYTKYDKIEEILKKELLNA